MKNILIFLTILLKTTLLYSQSFQIIEINSPPQDFSYSIEKNATFIKSMNMFAFDLLEEISTEQSDENIFFSPVSIYSALGLVYAGAHGATRNEVEKALHLEKTGDNIHDELSLFFE